jgi:HAD superfamily hydrolase (TIGR01509 family)
MKAGKEAIRILAGRYWVFDLDGTLTVPVHDFAAIRTHLGVPGGVDILGYLASLPEAEGRLLGERLEGIERELTVQTAAAPGVRELMDVLSRRHCRLGILTRNTREIARLTLTHVGLEGFFAPEEILGRNEARPKPEADGLHRLAGLWSVPAEELVMVGDYLHDLQAGRAAGAATIHIYGNRGRCWPEWADLHFLSLAALADAIPL